MAAVFLFLWFCSHDVIGFSNRRLKPSVIVQMKSGANNPQNSKRINNIISSASNIIDLRLKNWKESQSQRNSTIPISVKPLRFSFSAAHRQTIVLKDPHAAHKYLSLPASEYSLLDSSLVARSQISPDVFILTVPLGDMTSTTSSLTGVDSYIRANLQAEVTVRPDGNGGKVVMESGSIFFTPAADPFARDDEKANKTLSEVLPPWLIWGGSSDVMEGDIAMKSSSTSAEYIPTEGGNQSGMMLPDDADDDPLIRAGDISQVRVEKNVKSSVQIKFTCILNWVPPHNSENDIAKNSNKFFGGLANLFSKSRTSGKIAHVEADGNVPVTPQAPSAAEAEAGFPVLASSFISDPDAQRATQQSNVDGLWSTGNGGVGVDGDEDSDKGELEVRAAVRVDVEMNVPFPGEISSALSFGPVKALLSQGGSLVTKTVLTSLGPHLGELLVADHNRRRWKRAE